MAGSWRFGLALRIFIGPTFRIHHCCRLLLQSWLLILRFPRSSCFHCFVQQGTCESQDSPKNRICGTNNSLEHQRCEPKNEISLNKLPLFIHTSVYSRAFPVWRSDGNFTSYLYFKPTKVFFFFFWT